jgi:uncharacterized protein (TIGR03437 family)
MCNFATGRLLAAAALAAGLASAQMAPDWRAVGTLVSDQGLAGYAGGPVSRVWYSAEGGTLYAAVQSGRVYQTGDFERWQLSSAPIPALPPDPPVAVPERGAQVRASGGRLYAFGNFVFRSDDNGMHWENLTLYHEQSIVGSELRDLAVAPGNPDELVVAGEAGVFRSADGGRSWSGINEGLPNFPATRLLTLPDGTQGVRAGLAGDREVEWLPGEKKAWLPAPNAGLIQEAQLRAALSAAAGKTVTAVSISGAFIYAGTQDGELRVSGDRGASWSTFASGGGPVERFWIDTRDPRIALAVLGAAPDDPFRTAPAPQVLHTVNGGAFWDDFTANLADTGAHGITADRASGAMYVATDSGLFMSYARLDALAAPQSWAKLSGLPAVAAVDVKLDAGGNQLWVALDGYGIYAALAPHRLADPRVVSAADMVARAAAPGSLVTILGAQADAVRANGSPAAVVAATSTETQVQVPFESTGATLALSATVKSGALALPPLTLNPVAPAIFVARDGSPMLLDADRGLMLDAMTPAHPGARIQILATGLGRVTPGWPTGTPAPLTDPPRVAAPVTAYLDRAPVEVTRAELAPGYVGFYIVEIVIPKLVNYGPAELYIEAGGSASNRVRVYIEP